MFSPGLDLLDFPGKLFTVAGHRRALGLSRQNFVLLFVESVLESTQRRGGFAVVDLRFPDWDLFLASKDNN